MTAKQRAEVIYTACLPRAYRPQYHIIAECPVPYLDRVSPMLLLIFRDRNTGQPNSKIIAGRN